MISRSMMEFVVSIAVWLHLTVPSLSAVLSDPALALAGRDPVLWAMCHREISTQLMSFSTSPFTCVLNMIEPVPSPTDPQIPQAFESRPVISSERS